MHENVAVLLSRSQNASTLKLQEIEPSKAYRLFYPTLAVLLSASLKGEDDVIPIVSYCSLSFDPPLFGVAISPKNYTHKLVKGSGCFAFNIVDAAMAKSIVAAGDISARNEKKKLSIVGLELQKARKIHGKTVKGALAVIECNIQQTIQTGDHDLFVARRERAYASEDFNEYWQFKQYSPALYVGSTGIKVKKHRLAKLSGKFSEFPYIHTGR